MAKLIISDEDLRWLWGKKFETAKLLTVEDLLDLTIERGMELEELLSCLDEGILPGISQGVAKRFIEREIKEMIPEKVLCDPVFEKIASDSRKYFGTDDASTIIDYCTKHFLESINSGSPENVKRAMMAYIELGLGNFDGALANAGFAVNEAKVPNFGYELNQRTLTGMNALVVVARALAVTVLEVACEMQAKS